MSSGFCGVAHSATIRCRVHLPPVRPKISQRGPMSADKILVLILAVLFFGGIILLAVKSRSKVG
jgi:hypothetical protein